MRDGCAILTSFTRESGIYALEEVLKEVVAGGGRVEFLTSRYLGITKPSALYLLKRLVGKQGELRLYRHTNRSFHPKAYIIERPGETILFVGSSNVSKSGLETGVEWNYGMMSSRDPHDVRMFIREFEHLWNRESVQATDEVIKSYS